MVPAHRHALRLGGVTLAMFAFGFALGPLYDVLCESLGLNGKMRLEAAESLPTVVDRSRTVTVEFVTTVNGGKDWKFTAEKSRVRVHPGELATVSFYAENPEPHALVAQAVPNVAPWQAAKYLRKTECFCFQQQAFAAGEGRHMPVRFMIDPELPADVETVTLSYTFFEAPQLASARN